MKVLFVNSTHKILLEKLQKAGFFCDYRPQISRSEIETIVHNYDGVVIRSKISFDKDLIDKALRLKFIARVGAGLENIDLPYAAAKQILCLNSPEGNRDAVAEHALGMLLALFNNLPRANVEVKSGFWRREANRGIELKGKTVGIIGYGNMGAAFAQRLQGFGVRVISYDKYKTDYADGFTQEVDLEQIFEQSDVLTLHVPLTEETTYLFDNQFIRRFLKNIFLINTSRGKVVQTRALVSALRQGKVLGAALDVLEYENKSLEHSQPKKWAEEFQQLIDFEQVILSPHVAGWTHESKIKLAEILADKIIDWKLKREASEM